MKKNILFIVLLLPTILFSQKIYTVKEGLADNEVTCFFQDSQGFIWIGTINGLSRFDGYEFKNYFYTPGDSNSLTNNSITGIVEDNHNNLWISTYKGLNKYIRKKNKIVQFLDNEKDELALSNPGIYDMKLKGEKLYLATWDGISIMDLRTEKFFNTIINKESKWNEAPDYIFVDDDIVCYSTKRKGLYQFDINTKQIKKLGLKDTRGEYLPEVSITFLKEIKNIGLFIGTHDNGLHLLDLNTQKISRINEINGVNVLRTFDLVEHEDFMFVTTGELVFRVPKKEFILGASKEIERYYNSLELTKHLFISENAVLWLGKTDGGIEVINTKKEGIRLFSPKENVEFDYLALKLFEDKDNNTWLVQNDLFWLNPHFQMKKDKPKFLLELQFSEKEDVNIYQSKNKDFWFFNNEVLFHQKKEEGILRRLNVDLLDNEDYIGCFEDDSGQFYVVCSHSFLKLNKQNKFEKINYDLKKFPGAINSWWRLENTNKMFINSYLELVLYNISTNELEVYVDGSIDGIPPIYTITDLVPVSDSIVLVGFNQGLYKIILNRHKGELVKSLGNRTICGIEQDRGNRLWVSTYNGLFVLDEEGNVLREIYRGHGTGTDDYLKKIAWTLSNGDLVFPSAKKIVFIDPEKYMGFQEAKDFPLKITGIRAVGDDEQTEMNEFVSSTASLRVPFKYRSVDIRFALLEYINPDKIKYSYRLKGASDNWIDIGNTHQLTFSYLAPGEYQLQVKAMASNGVLQHSEINLNIEVLPPWYGRTWFKFAIGLFVLLMFYVIYRIRVRNIKRYSQQLESEVKARTSEIEQQKEELAVQTDNLQEANMLLKERHEEIEAASEELQTRADEISRVNSELKKLNATKDKFFSIIAHDLKNPFMSIMGFSELLLKKPELQTPEKIPDFVGMIYKSSASASELLNSLLAWARSQTDSIDYHPEPFRLSQVTDNTISLLKLNADNKNLSIVHDVPATLVVFADKNMMTTVIRNLLNNAIKFTPNGGEITIKAEMQKDMVQITVADNGVGMKKATKMKLFQIDGHLSTKGTSGEQGTGLGLIICEEFVTKNKGSITVESEPGKGSEFIITLPHNEESFIESTEFMKTFMNNESNKIMQEFNDIIDPNDEVEVEIDDDQYRDMQVLIIEDNDSIRKNLITTVQDTYQIYVAENGEDGWKLALEKLPDLIISDVMMPKMDGFELSGKLKNDERTSHIPIILLTARTSDASKIKGLEQGIDEYLTKPFNPRLLLTHIKNIFYNRQKLRDKFISDMDVKPEEVTTTSKDEHFLKKAMKLVDENISNTEFSVDVFVKAMGMSRTQLYRKMHQVTGQSVSEFVRGIRMKKAAGLLLNPDNNVSDVAYKVGMNDLQTLTRNFKQYFGIPPIEWKKRNS